MTFDRMDNFSGGVPGSLPRRSLVTPSVEAQGSSELDDNLLGIVAGRGAMPDTGDTRTLTRQWADKSAMWGGREAAAAAVNSVTSSKTKMGQQFNTAQQQLYSKLKINSAGKEVVQNTATPAKNYSSLMRLGSEQVQMKDLSWSKYSTQVKSNLSPFREAIKSKNIGNFFQGVTVKGYLKDTVVGSNIKPIKELVTNSPTKQVGTGVFQTAALGLLGYDVVKHTHDAYKSAKAKEDGSVKSKLNTYKETAVAFGKYAFRNAATWEAAGVGAAIGRAVVPLALGPVSLGGIAVGTVVGLAAQKALDRAMNTGDKDPVQQEKARKEHLEKAAKSAMASKSKQADSQEAHQNPFKIQPA